MGSKQLLAAVALASMLHACGTEPISNRIASKERNSAEAIFPRLTGRVVDEADLLKPEQENDISSKSETLETLTGRQFVVVTVKSLSGQNSAAYTPDLGNYWGIGSKERNDGVILLVAPNEQEIRIAVGDGLANVLPDARAKQILDEAVLPLFRRGEMPEGITAGSDAILKNLSRPSAH